jgi:ABC-type nitrate/sulfonate/bicarbonate transport system substrate-binding protein
MDANTSPETVNSCLLEEKMLSNKNKIYSIGGALMVASLILAACGPQATPSAAAPTVAQEAPTAAQPAPTAQPPAPTTAPVVAVRVGMTPFFDYQFWSVAKEFGWDKELGLDLQFTWLTQSGPSIEALANGSLDTVNTCVVCNFPFYSSVPDMQDFLTVEQFKGFVVIGRQGKSKSYQEFLTELNDPAKAKTATIDQFKGKTFPEYLANYKTLLTAVLGQEGMKITDVNTVNFADDEKAALALVGGTGDFYMGGLPSEINLLQNHPDQFKLIGGAEILGPAGLWYSNIASTKQWLAKNPDAVFKIMAMSYRYNRYVQDQPDKILPIVVKAMNDHSGVATTAENLKFIFDTFLDFRTYQQDQKTTYDPTSPLFWETSAKYYTPLSTDLPAGADYNNQNPLNDWFNKFLQQKDLLAWVDAPLK